MLEPGEFEAMEEAAREGTLSQDAARRLCAYVSMAEPIWKDQIGSNNRELIEAEEKLKDATEYIAVLREKCAAADDLADCDEHAGNVCHSWCSKCKTSRTADRRFNAACATLKEIER